jgi:catechol 2,3-dioxygenase-like lactoylglutathione lyase family enzyme
MREFYVERLGLPPVFHHRGRMVGLETGGAMLVLDATKKKLAPVYLGFTSKNIGRVLEKLEGAGTKIVLQPSPGHWGQLIGAFEDPEGNIIYLEESVRNARQMHSHRRSVSRTRSRPS